jgi:hypothetical protein
VFEPDYYKEQYSELATLTDQEALDHYRTEGIVRGYTGSPGAYRGNLIAFVQSAGSILEIGPFHSPAVKGIHVRYLDAFDKAQLLERAKELGLDPSNVPDIDYVAPRGGTLSIGNFLPSLPATALSTSPILCATFRGPPVFSKMEVATTSSALISGIVLIIM